MSYFSDTLTIGDTSLEFYMTLTTQSGFALQNRSEEKLLPLPDGGNRVWHSDGFCSERDMVVHIPFLRRSDDSSYSSHSVCHMSVHREFLHIDAFLSYPPLLS